MEKSRYKQMVKKYTPKENRLFNGFVAFVSGGIMGVIGQGLVTFYVRLLDVSTKEASSYMILTLILLDVYLHALVSLINGSIFVKLDYLFQ